MSFNKCSFLSLDFILVIGRVQLAINRNDKYNGNPLAVHYIDHHCDNHNDDNDNNYDLNSSPKSEYK